MNVAEIRDADLPVDTDAVTGLWLEYLNWGNDGLDANYGFRLPVQEAVERDLASIGKFLPPHGRLLLAIEHGEAIGTAALQSIGTSTAEVKRMWVAPACRRSGMKHRGSPRRRPAREDSTRVTTPPDLAEAGAGR